MQNSGKEGHVFLLQLKVATPLTLWQLSSSLPFLYEAVAVDDWPELASRAISTIAKNSALFSYSCTEALTYEY